MEKITTEILILGGGPGGYSAAFLAADKGKQVLLINDAPTIGGVCLHEGCIPSKSLLHAVKVLNDTKEASAIGIHFNGVTVDLPALRAWKNSVITKLSSGLDHLAQQRKVTLLQGQACFLDAHTVAVIKPDGGTQQVTFQNAIIATGSRPAAFPGLPDSPHILNAQTALDLPSVPSKLLVIGAGYIGLELGSMYAGLGSEVSVVEKLPQLLPEVDKDVLSVLNRQLRKTFKKLLLQSSAEQITATEDGFSVSIKDSRGSVTQENYDKILIAVGRKPNSTALGLKNTKIQTDARGFVSVNNQGQTHEAHIYAIGDVTGGPLLAHKAAHDGKAVIEHICDGKIPPTEKRLIPAVIFTDPEIATVGLTETQAKAMNKQIVVAKFPWAASGKALTQNRPDGATKFIIDPDSEKILGVSIVGVGAGDLIMEGALAIHAGCTIAEMKNLIHPHPTLSESLMETAEVFFGTCTNLYKPKR